MESIRVHLPYLSVVLRDHCVLIRYRSISPSRVSMFPHCLRFVSALFLFMSDAVAMLMTPLLPTSSAFWQQLLLPIFLEPASPRRHRCEAAGMYVQPSSAQCGAISNPTVFPWDLVPATPPSVALHQSVLFNGLDIEVDNCSDVLQRKQFRYNFPPFSFSFSFHLLGSSHLGPLEWSNQ